MGSPASTGLDGKLTIDLGAIAKNWRALDKVSAGALTGAVVKGDAYGTGMLPASDALFQAGARFFFVATPDEGIALRKAFKDIHIFVLNGLHTGGARAYVQHKLMPMLCSLPQLEEWLAICTRHNEAFPAGLQFDTGMNRLGFRLQETDAVREHIDQFGYLPQVVMSHLACADQPGHEKNRTQLALFQSILASFPGIPASLANSAGLMTSRDMHFQMVRPGISLYGGRAVSGRANPMSHVVKLEAPILQVREAKIGETVGYGATYRIDRDTKLALISLGYGDGLFRALSGSNTRPGGKVAINGTVLPIVGRVSMDTAAVDLTALGDQLPAPGDMAEILGPHVSVDDQADIAGTIGYEILTALKGRYRRSYIPPKPRDEG